MSGLYGIIETMVFLEIIFVSYLVFLSQLWELLGPLFNIIPLQIIQTRFTTSQH